MGSQTTSTPALLERESELEALTAAVARAAEGTGGVVLIEGPAGVGKSRLLASARSSAREAGMQALEARGAVLERDYAFGVARQLFEQTALEVTDTERSALFAGAAGLAERLVGEGGRAMAPQDGDAEFGALHGLYWLTANLTDRAPLLLSVDDAHWADPSSLRFLAYLSRRLEGLPVLLVVSARASDPEGTGLWRELSADPAARVLHPRPLTADGAALVVRRSLGGDADDEFCRACHRATGGNPLFLRELVGALSDADVAPTSAASRTVTEVGPPAVSRFVLRRVERLGPSATSLARAVAVLGGQADIGLAAAAAGIDAGEARSVADRLVRADVLAHDQLLGFVHPIVQVAVYEDLLPGERAARHLAVARLLDEAGAPAERVATHLLQSAPAGEPGRVEALRAAAASAEQRGAPAAAVAYLRRAVDEPPPGGVRAELLGDLGRLEIRAQDPEAGHAHLLEALETPGDAAVHARAAIWLSRSANIWGRPDWAAVALNAIDDQLDAADPELTLELESEALTLTRLELSLRHLVADRLAGFDRRAAGHPRYEPIARIHAASERMLLGVSAMEVADEIEEALAGGPPADPYALGMAIDLLVKTERHDAAIRWLDLTIEAARAHGLAPQLAGLHTQRAVVELARGAVGEAELDIQTALRLAGERHFTLPRIVGVAIDVALERGEVQAAAQLAERHGETLARERVLVDEYLVSRGRLRIVQGDVRDGLADLLRCGEIVDSLGIVRPTDWRSDAAGALAELGETERAERLARDGMAAARAFGAPRALARSLRSAGRVIGGDEGLELLEEAVSVVEPSPARLEAAYALADLGAELVKRRRRREGREALRLALELAQKCGASALADRARGNLGAGGGRPPRLEQTGVDALTPAERRVCDLAAGELTNREIAQTLFVTEKTVELHLTNAYRKLGIRSRFQLASVISQ
jgi:DNA-binding CsgD family transcriptional regulator